MNLTWTCENPAWWDSDKARVIGGVEPGSINFTPPELGGILPGLWWRVAKDGVAVAYGWMDVVWGEAEIMLAVDPIAREIGVGGMVLEQLEREAAALGVSYLHNAVPASHPDREEMTRWLVERGFSPGVDPERLVRRVRRAEKQAA